MCETCGHEKRVPDEIGAHGNATSCRDCQRERHRARGRRRWLEKVGVPEGQRVCQWCGRAKVIGEEILPAGLYCTECKRERQRAKVRRNYRRKLARMTPAELEAYRKRDAAWARAKRKTEAGRESDHAAVQRWRERHRERYLASARRSKAKAMSDPKRAEQLRADRRMNYRLTAAREGRQVRVPSEQTYAKRNGTALGKLIPTEPLAGLISEWIGELGGRSLSNGSYDRDPSLRGAGYEQLAELCGISDRTLRAVVTGERKTLHYVTADAICAAVDFPIAALYPDAE